ncbi:ER protein Pkr1-domain-containing protein [Dipodascopsis uninucleata]
MSDFFKDLWDSIFTPGTTPTLVRATHYSFAALLVTLVALFATTYNKHFFILTCIAGSLWGVLTWFIGELEKMKEEMEKQNKPIEGEVKIDNAEKESESDEKVEKTADEKKDE